MKRQLTPHEARVIGALIEKAITTPDQYPLSVNALTNACNQRSNRDPVVNLSEATVQATLDDLGKRYLVSKAGGYGSRVTKYQHRFCNTEYGDLKLDAQELAIVCELLLRGPQTPGELRAHAERMSPFGDVSEVEAALHNLMAREEPLVCKLPREPGKREARYAHLFFGDAPAVADSDPEPRADDEDRLSRLERTVEELSAELDRVKEALAALQSSP